MNLKNWYLSTVAEQAAGLARRYGLGIELAQFCTPWNMDEHFEEVDSQVRAMLRASDRFILHAPFNELFPCAIDPKARQLAFDRYSQALDLAVRYGAKKVVIHGGYNPWLYYPVWYTEQSPVFWREFLERVPEGITVCLENVLEEEPELLKAIVDQVDSACLQLCLDIGHAHAYSRVPVEDWLEAWGSRISHFHIHNNDGSWDNHCPLFEGTIDVKSFLHQAAQLCPEATYTLELTEAEPSVRWLLEECK